MAHAADTHKESYLKSLITYNKDIPAIPFILLGLALCAVGGITAIMVFVNGHAEMYNVTRQVSWGLLISTYAYFVITSTGIAFIGGLGHAFGFEKYAMISRRIVVLATIVLLAGFTQILMELGNPLKMIYMMITPNFKAPIFWMGMFYGVELVILAVELFLIFKPNQTKADHKLAAVAGFLALLVGVLATSNLGFVFGSLNARPWFHGIHFSTFLVVSGITGGAALLILIHNIVYKFNVPSRLQPSMASLGKLMGGGIGVMIFLYLWKMITSIFNMPGDAYLSALSLIKGQLAAGFWIGEMGLAIIIPLVLIVFAKGNPKTLALAGFVFLIGLFFTRYNYVVAGQLPPMREGLPGSGVETNAMGLLAYSPSVSEWLIFALGFGVFFLLYFAAEKFLDLETKDHH
ncbi:NrfD/PsrC family molybdoenzyme membrane anchor subunit [Limisalsivibrio acetivorans]|uniref:NrfD/PsrC family molybdoenzyme membrane anchor subunit n=1 Tax=Limisalsivibrio acetivorans TaxID=1304888 RepID=UPI0003B3CC51|nr:NrfD/PsrC family molybdoenzyme membrane anchor subunit [Limisalsivibrio acetivorans]